MICGIHYFIRKLKTKIDVIPMLTTTIIVLNPFNQPIELLFLGMKDCLNIYIC